MAKTKHYLAIDLGAESGRTIVGSVTEDSLVIEETHRFPNQPVILPSGLHWDVLKLWSDIKAGISLSARKYSGDISSIALDTWGVDFGLLDRQDLLLSNPFHYRDLRTDGMIAEAFKRIPKQTIYQSTGIQFMKLNTLYQLLSMVVSKSPILDIAACLLTMPDLFHFWLCGAKQSEFTIATTTQCLDPCTGNWAYQMLEKLKIPTKIFPEIVPTGTRLGLLRASLTEETGLSGTPVVAPAAHDTGSAVVAVPAENDHFAWISSGTWSIMGVVSPEPVITDKSLAYNFTNEGGAENTWRLSKNITGLWLVQACKQEWDLSYDELTQLARNATGFRGVIDVDDDIFLHPGDMPGRIRQYCVDTHQPVPETPGELVRLVLESLALKYRMVLEQLENMLGYRLDPIHIIGGGTKNKLLNQLTADATGRKVITGPVEATAIGNVIMQSVAMGQFASLSEARAIIRASFDVEEYHPNTDSRWDQLFQVLVEGNEN